MHLGKELIQGDKKLGISYGTSECSGENQQPEERWSSNGRKELQGLGGRGARKDGKDIRTAKEAETKKAVSIQRKDRVFLVGDSLVRHVGRNLQKQCAGFDTVCKPGARIEQMFLESEKKEEKEDTVIVQVGTNNLRMDETEEMMSKYKDMIQRLNEDRKGQVVVMGILPMQDLSEALDSKRVEANSRLKKLCEEEMVRYCEVEFNPWKGGYLGRDGLHLNARGADMVARQLYIMMKTLNLVGRRLVQ